MWLHVSLSAAELTHTPPVEWNERTEVVRTRHLHHLQYTPGLPHCFAFLVQLLDCPSSTGHFPQCILTPHDDDLASRQRAARLRVQQHATRLLEREVERHAVW